MYSFTDGGLLLKFTAVWLALSVLNEAEGGANPEPPSDGVTV